MAPRAREAESAVLPVPGSEDQIVGRRFIRLIEDQLAHLHAQPAHANRQVFFDQVVLAHLLAFFNPTLRGLRGIEDVFEERRVRKHYHVPHLPKSTLSDAQRIFDPQLLVPILRSLQQRAGIQPHDTRLDELTRKIIAVDGSFFTVAPRIAWAVFNNSGKGNVRLHVQLNVLTGLPEQVSLTDGQTTETGQLRLRLVGNCLYIEDRGFQDYQLCADIIHAGSDFVVRLRKSACTRILEELPLSAADLAAGVQKDARVQLGWRSDQTPKLPVLRRIEVAYTNRKGETETIILLTNRLDLPAHIIALLYQHRWQVELFFRWLKCTANFNHFFSESLNGMTLQVYVTMIGLLLIAIETGAKPSKYDYTLLSFVFSGQMAMDSALEIAARRRAERKRAAEWQKAYNARKKTSR
jgi:hypothetical protein